MSTTPSLATDASRLLHRDLYGHLDEADFLALKFEQWNQQDVDSARKLIPDLVVVIRGLLIEHEAKPDGDCRICPSAWPCPVVTMIHALVRDPDREFVALLRRADHDE